MAKPHLCLQGHNDHEPRMTKTARMTKEEGKRATALLPDSRRTRLGIECTTESRHAPRVNKCPRIVPSSTIPALRMVRATLH